MNRSFSFSEASTALDCFARHAFAYTGRLTDGEALRAKHVAPKLDEGKAWGAACAAWHATGDLTSAVKALDDVMDEVAKRQQEHGLFIAEQLDQMRTYLIDLLVDYSNDAQQLEGLTRLEQELLVPIPSRTGNNYSSRYRFLSYIDGWWVDDWHQAWLVEFKLRDDLMDAWQIQLSRQMRWYSWAWAQRSGIVPVGVLMDERRNAVPKEPRLVNARSKRELQDMHGKTPSHAQDQLCRSEDYVRLCGEYGVDYVPETLDALAQRRWQQRVPVLFREDELDETGKELVTAAKLIQLLDSGELYPLRNAKPSNCRGCRFKDICPAPDEGLVDELFERVPPKRLRALAEQVTR